MKTRSRLLLVLVAALAACGTVAVAKPSPTHRGASRAQRVKEIAEQAFIYGWAPLTEQHVIVNFPANTLISVTQLATPAERLVVLPNVDTLYTVARLTLTNGPMVVHVPDEHGRYYTMQLLDTYTNSFAYIGRRATGTRAGNFAIVGPGWHGKLPAGVRRIQAPTPTVWLLGRTLVKSPGDISAVNSIQRAYTLTPLSGFGGPPLPALYLASSKLKPAPVPSGLAFYDALDTLLAQEPPPHSDHALLQRFASVGIAPGRKPSMEPLDAATRQGLLAGLTAGRRALGAYAQRLERTSQRQHNQWLVPPKATGNYGTNYLLRAYIAKMALGANVPAEAIYPSAFVDSQGRALTGAHRYVIHFAAGKLPPVGAFWSLTMYGNDLFLVPNPINRYAIGDRTPGLRRSRDGSLTIQLSHSPPRGGRSNWLPAPAGGFKLVLRLYQPKASVLSGRWPLPKITRVR